jgi:membrane-bound lytic murein transglycosylase D
MKKIIILIFLGLFILTNCMREKTETEPPMPVEQVEKEPEPEAVKIEKEAEENDVKSTIEKSTIEPAEKAESKPLEPEEIPLIKVEPITKPPKIESYSTKIGITGIVREFGYAGDIKIPENFEKRVEHYINYFSKNEKAYRFYIRAMNRGQKYFPLIRKVLEEKKLPLSLVYLPLIESGYNPNARSRAGAVGMWQFMRGTARMYGLTITRRKDDRKDPVKSTHAAAEYLNDLLAMFGAEDPFLGLSAYNAGEGKILRSLRKISYTERSFWTLARKNLLRNETQQYIPRLIAVVLLAENQEKYGLKVKKSPVEENESEDNEIIASLHPSKDDLDEKESEIIALEPEKINPEEVRKNITSAKEEETKNYVVYRVKRRDSLYKISRKFNVKIGSIKEWNGLKTNRIYTGQKLKIYGAAQKDFTAQKKSKARVEGYRLIYTVNYTDSLARIALFFRGVSARDIMHWNHLKRTRIYPKQKLILYLKKEPKKMVTHIVKRGETAKGIAQKYNVRVEYVLSLNGLLTDSRLNPGMKLKVYYFY